MMEYTHLPNEAMRAAARIDKLKLRSITLSTAEILGVDDMIAH